MVFAYKYIKIKYFYFKKLFLISAYQNDLKYKKIYFIYKKIKFLKNTILSKKKN